MKQVTRTRSQGPVSNSVSGSATGLDGGQPGAVADGDRRWSSHETSLPVASCCAPIRFYQRFITPVHAGDLPVLPHLQCLRGDRAADPRRGASDRG